MNERRPSDVQLARALRANLPAAAPAGIRDRVLATVEATPQQRPLPSFLGALTDADPIVRRRSLLVAALLLLLVAMAGATVAGAFREARLPDFPPRPATQGDAIVTAAYEGLLDLPPFRLAMLDGDVFYHDGAGTIRWERPGWPSFRLISKAHGGTTEVMAPGTTRVWVEDAPSDVDPRLEMARQAAVGLGDGRPACEAGWAYVGDEDVRGRSTRRVSCAADVRDMWLDAATGLVLRIRDRAGTHDTGELEIGPQPAALFVPNPEGLRVMSFRESLCAADIACRSPRPVATPRPVVRPPEAPSGDPPPGDLQALVDAVRRSREHLSAMEVVVTHYGDALGFTATVHQLHDGAGRFRTEVTSGGNGDTETVTYVDPGDGHVWRARPQPDGSTVWAEATRESRDEGTGSVFGRVGMLDGADLVGPEGCPAGWQHRGFDVVLGRPAHHLVCGLAEVWIDREWLLVVRTQDNPDRLHTNTSVTEVTEIRFVQPAPELLRLPDDAVVACPACESPQSSPTEPPRPAP